MNDYNHIICWMNEKNAVKFISLLPSELADQLVIDVSDGGIALAWKR